MRVHLLSFNYQFDRSAGRQEGMQSSVTDTNESGEMSGGLGRNLWKTRYRVSTPRGTPLRISMRAGAFSQRILSSLLEKKVGERERERRGEIHLARRLDAKTSVLSLH